MSMACNQACPYNTLNGCKVNEYGAICPMSNMVFEEKPMTNADRIRAMTDEELIAWAHNQIGCGISYFPCGVVCDGECNTYSREECDDKILKWLQQPAEGDA